MKHATLLSHDRVSRTSEATEGRWSWVAGYGAHVLIYLPPPPADLYPQLSAENHAETAAQSQPPNTCCCVRLIHNTVYVAALPL